MLGVVKDGTTYEAWKCEEGHARLVDTLRHHVPVTVETRQGVPIAEVCCGQNCFIFDRRLFRSALRTVLTSARKCARDLVLDLSQIGFVGEPLLSAVRLLDNGMKQRGRRLWIVTPSAVVAGELLAAAPRLAGRVIAKAAEALARATGGAPELQASLA